MSQLPHILPDYMLVFAVPVLTHDIHYTQHDDPVQLKWVEKCLWFILEPLITNKEFFCYGFYKNLIERMKNHKDAYKTDCERTNFVSEKCVEIFRAFANYYYYFV
jgi:sister chromatid cohesion protein PDS5